MERANLPTCLVAWKPLRGIVLIAAGLILLGWLLNTPEGLLGKADAIGYAVCHRIDLRSFYLGERQMPLCARCSGMYLGAVLGLSWLAFSSPRRGGLPAKSTWPFLALFVLAFAFDGLNSFLSLFPGAPSIYSPQNWLRLLTGSGMGLVIAVYLFPAFNQTVWQNWDSRPALSGLRALGLLASLALAVDLLLLTQSPLVLYPAALISAGGVLLILTMTYTVLLLILLRAENRYNQFSQLLLPLAGGFIIAMLQIILIDWLRFLITGTWDGFHLG